LNILVSSPIKDRKAGAASEDDIKLVELLGEKEQWEQGKELKFDDEMQEFNKQF
jgi:hypothetical protein